MSGAVLVLCLVGPVMSRCGHGASRADGGLSKVQSPPPELVGLCAAWATGAHVAAPKLLWGVDSLAGCGWRGRRCGGSWRTPRLVLSGMFLPIAE